MSGVIGVGGSLPRKEVNIVVFCLRNTGTGSEEGVRVRLLLVLLLVTGVTGVLLVLPVSLRANFRKGDMDRDRVELELGALDDLGPLGGVAR